MDNWPTDNRTTRVVSGRAGKSKAPPPRDYPYIEGGATNAVTLIEHQGKFKWDSLVASKPNGNAGPIVRAQDTQIIFPATRPPAIQIPPTTIKERAEQGAHFLRTYLPDVEITSEVIREEVTKDAVHLRGYAELDPYKMDILASFSQPSGSHHVPAFLAFPMGELNTNLNISPFIISEDSNLVFTPTASPIRSFDTPIQQIAASTSNLAVRTYGSTTLFHVIPNNATHSSSVMSLEELASIPTSSTARRSVTDINLHPSSGDVCIVNDLGAIFRWSLLENRRIDGTQQFNDRSRLENFADTSVNPPQATRSPTELFWRLSRGIDSNALYRASSKTVDAVDLRSSFNPAQCFNLDQKDELITSIEAVSSDNIIRLVTTKELVWLDTRFPGRRPLLAYKHGRQYDRTLSTQTVAMQGQPYTFLLSQNTSLVTVYDVGRSKDQRIQVNRRPYCLASDGTHGVPYSGQLFLNHPYQDSGKGTSLFRLSHSGALYRVDVNLDVQDGDHDSEMSSPKVRWRDDVAALDVQSRLLRSDPGPLGAHDKSVVNLLMFQDHFAAEAADVQKTRTGVADIVERMPSFWQESAEPVEHMLTVYDIAFRTGDEPAQSSRADFFTQSPITSSSGYRALSQDLLPTTSIARDAKWHYSLANTFRALSIEAETDVSLLDGQFHRYDLKHHPERTYAAIQKEQEARQKLIVDLRLGSDVFSAQPFAPKPMSTTPFETMSRATQALTLGGEPPPVEYGYLKPFLGEKGEESPEEDHTPLGVRLLLKEWDVGANPHEYIYHDPYDDSSPQLTLLRSIEEPSSKPTEASKLPSQSQRPPTVIPAKSLIPTIKKQPELSMRTRMTFGSFSQAPAFQATSTSQPAGPEESQYTQEEVMASTQVEPGPYGGRPSTAKKKQAKKQRMGGF
ncbi:hypothetical protein PC9H_001055 [Pleurotus ostreatus]|uniref:Uncharacterized protein n=1 Tax=Pleurotus ostreatus TaxID=5322 RepID=A0A8H7DYC2_PLEOS|nr:uncharacterized protein PC9H_001055 [Pleurotus ostreatus]KAF7440708.1 hypothetical protein PC9H_001055 [Pleurotus ostreatus]